MNNLLIDLDGIFPNYALMKLSQWLKAKGESVWLNDSPSDFERVWISTVFSWNRTKALSIKNYYESCGIDCILGGSGYDIHSRLPDGADEMLPDYTLYDDDRIVGFCQRGCNRKCQFCIVPEKEGFLWDHSFHPISEWLPEGAEKVLLLDNNLAMSDNHDRVLEEAANLKLKLSITQGYDIRCVTKDKTALLAQNKPWDLKFTNRRLYIAWDYIGIEGWIRRNLPILLDCFKPKEIMCYLLCGFNTSAEQDLHRVKVLTDEFGVLPYIMPYNNRRDIPELNKLRRWVNRRYYNFIGYNEFQRPGWREEAVKEETKE
jgi:hypothetical protein